MEGLISALIIAAVAAMILLLTNVRIKRVQRYTDDFADAFCAFADAVLPYYWSREKLSCVTLENGTLSLLPVSEQPENIKTALEQGISEAAKEQLLHMAEAHRQAQEYLGGFNLISGKYQRILSNVETLAKCYFAIAEHPETAVTKKELEDFQLFFNRQAHLRNVTLAAIVSEACQKRISIGWEG